VKAFAKTAMSIWFPQQEEIYQTSKQLSTADERPKFIHDSGGGACLIKDRVCGNMVKEVGRYLNFIKKLNISNTNTEILAWKMCCFTGSSHHPHI
jgi:hypothetical protein